MRTTEGAGGRAGQEVTPQLHLEGPAEVYRRVRKRSGRTVRAERGVKGRAVAIMSSRQGIPDGVTGERLESRTVWRQAES